MKRFQYTLAITFLSISFFYGHTQQSQPDAIYQDIQKEYKLNNDGSITYHYSHKLKLTSYFAIQRQYGETSIIYDPRYQKVNVIRAFTETPEGKEIPVPANGITEVLPDFASNAPSYNYLRRFVIVHTGFIQILINTFIFH